MADYLDLRKKYPKWAHRLDYHRKHRRRSRRKRRRRRRAVAPTQSSITTILLTQLLQQIMGTGVIRPLARKHGENVLTGYTNAVTPDRLAPVRSRDEYGRASAGPPGRGFGVGVGAAAGAGQPRGRMPD